MFAGRCDRRRWAPGTTSCGGAASCSIYHGGICKSQLPTANLERGLKSLLPAVSDMLRAMRPAMLVAALLAVCAAAAGAQRPARLLLISIDGLMPPAYLSPE